MVFTTTLLLIATLNFATIWLRNRLRKMQYVAVRRGGSFKGLEKKWANNRMGVQARGPCRTTEIIKLLEMHLDGRLLESVDVAAGGLAQVIVQVKAGGSAVEIQGFCGGELVVKPKLPGV